MRIICCMKEIYNEEKKLAWHELSEAKVLELLDVDPSVGLGDGEAERRLHESGPNTYDEPPKDSVLMMVLRQFKDVANVILLFAGFLSLALAIREGHGYIEPIVIFAIIAMNFTLSITQERSAEKALEALQKLNAPACLVLRAGRRVEIGTQQVVPGDILSLKTGDFVPADARLLTATNLTVDESSLTGESEPAEKDAASRPEQDAVIGDRTNMVFSGCLVTGGNAAAVVTQTGMRTQMGKIAGYLNNSQKLQTPLQKRLNRLSRIISLIAVVSAVVLLMDGLWNGEEFWTMMLAAVSLAVAAVPETLQLIVTLTLTHGVKKMVSQHALIRKLPAVETLGNTSVICSDKTGTLTQNRMAIQRIWAAKGDAISSDAEFDDAQRLLLQRFAMASNATIRIDADGVEHAVGDATELAIVRLAMSKGEEPKALSESMPRVAEIPFSSARKMMTSVHRLPDGTYLVLTKGAFDRLPFVAVDVEEQAGRQAVHDGFAQDALRVLALGSRIVRQLPPADALEGLEADLRFEGLIGLIDPPRPEAMAAIERAHKAGIRTVMITGDHVATAAAIARQIGLLKEGEKVVTGKELAAMSDEDLIESVSDYSVYARVSPEDKIRIVEAWQENGAVVSMTGDGVNDAPALKAADVGVAMGITGTEVSKSAADMVLTDDNFSTIVTAVKEGRNVFSNIRKTIFFLLTCNLSEIVIMLGGQMMGWGLVLTPVMLLLINVFGDGVPGLRLSQEESDPRIMTRKPIGREESFLGGGLLGVIIQQTIAFSVVGWIAYYIGAFVDLSSGFVPSHIMGQTMTFVVVSYTSILHIFTVRSRKSIFRRTIMDNLPLLWSALAMIVVFTLMVIIPPVGAIFGLVPISLKHWAIASGLIVIPTIVAEIGKLWANRHDAASYRRRLVKHLDLGESL